MAMEEIEITVLNDSATDLAPYDNFSYYGDYYDMYNFYRVPQMVLVSLLCLSIILGNSCVLAAIRLSETGRKSRMNFFIMHLAIADLLVGVMVSLTDLAQKITIDWYAGNALCKIINFTQAVVTYSSTYMLVSLSLDRYDAVARPMSFSRSAQKGRVLVIVAWAVSMLFALPTPFIYQQATIMGRHQCWLDFPERWHWNLYFTVVAVVTFFIPALIIAGCYIAIIYIIWSKGRTETSSWGSCFACNKSSLVNSFGNSNSERTYSRSRPNWSHSSPCLTISSSRHETGRGIIPQAKIRTIKMTLIIVIVFILCWSPFFIYNLLELYEVIPHNNQVSTLIQSVAPLNSAANPIIYGIFSTRICRNLRRIPCLRRSTCPCAGGQDRHQNNFHAHHNNYHQQQHYHSYNTYHNTTANTGAAVQAKRNYRPHNQVPASLSSENTAMTVDLHKVRSSSTKSGNIATHVKGQGNLVQSIPMVPIGNSKRDDVSTHGNQQCVSSLASRTCESPLSGGDKTTNDVTVQGVGVLLNGSQLDTLMKETEMVSLETSGAHDVTLSPCLSGSAPQKSSCLGLGGRAVILHDKAVDLMQFT